MRDHPDPQAPAAWYDDGTPLIPAQHQPALVLEGLQALDVAPATLQAAAGLHGPPPALYTPAQLLALLRGAARLQRNDPELPFQLGRQWLPGHFGAASHALLTASSLRRAMTVLALHAARLSPLLVPHLVVEGGRAALVWTAACACAGQRAFLVDLQMGAFAATCHWLAGERLPWTFLFNRGEPARRDAHEVHLGHRLRFRCQLDAMVIDSDQLDRAWRHPRALDSARLTAALDQEALDQQPRRSLLALLYDHLQARLHAPPGLEETAAAFGVSPATLKRRLAACGTHFQAELDQVRLHAALRLMHGRGMDNEAVARHLGIGDAANFRRAVKRWAGLTPAQLRAGWRPGAEAPV